MTVVVYMFCWAVSLLMGLTLAREVGFFYLNWTVSFSRGSSALFSSRLSWQVATLFQSTEENSIRDLVIARTKTASSGSSNGNLQKEQSKSITWTFPNHFRTNLQHILWNRKVAVMMTLKREDLKILNFQKVFFYQI